MITLEAISDVWGKGFPTKVEKRIDLPHPQERLFPNKKTNYRGIILLNTAYKLYAMAPVMNEMNVRGMLLSEQAGGQGKFCNTPHIHSPPHGGRFVNKKKQGECMQGCPLTPACLLLI